MAQNKRDVFDRIMSLPGLRKLFVPYQKHKKVLLYLFFGGLTTVISIGSFVLFDNGLGINALVANVFSWILAVTFAYFTNRVWVFTSRAKGQQIMKEAASFVTGRLFTLAFEEIIILIFVEHLAFNSTWVKILAQLGVLILNYLIAKLFVFKKA